MKTRILITLTVLSLLFSCKPKTIKPDTEQINSDLLTTKSRHIVKAVYRNKNGLESNISSAWQDCVFLTSYKFNEDSTYVIGDSCMEDEIIWHWVFKENKSKIYAYYNTDTLKYLILKLTENQLMLEHLNDNTEYQTIYTYE